MNLKTAIYALAVLLVLCSSCGDKPLPKAPPIQPTPPRRETLPDYWLSHPAVVLLSGKYGVGVDTIMDICHEFNSMYVREPHIEYDDRDNRAYYILPYYTGVKGQGPTPAQSQAFFTEQYVKYGINKKDVAEMITSLYARSNSFTPREE